MKNMLYIFLAVISVLLCGCGFNGSVEMSGGDEVRTRPIGPVKDPTHDELVENTGYLLSAAIESRQIMNELAEQENVSKKGIKAAKKVNKKYEKRLSELENTDFSGSSDEELYKISEEISDIISEIRKARDLLQGI